MSRDVTTGVQAMEQEAQQLLEDAEARANEIREKARQEASQLLNSELPLEDVQKECDETISEARERADAEVARTEKQASDIRENARKRVQEIAQHLVNVVTGVESA